MPKSPAVVLINPPVHDFAAYDFWAKPLGLLVIAEHLKKSGVEVKLIDALDPFHPALDGLPAPKRRSHGAGKYYEEEMEKPQIFRDIRRKYRRFGLPLGRLEHAMRSAGKADAVLVTSAMTYWYPGAFEAIAIARKVWPKATVMLGGIYATLCEEHARNNSGADAVLPGPWEKSLSVFKQISGIETEAPEGFLFSPALDLYTKLNYAPLLTSRGCPLRCNYCASVRLFDKFVVRDYKDVLVELENSLARGINDFAFYDDALLWDAGKGLAPLLEAVATKGYKVRFHTPNGLHVDRVDVKIAKLMKRAGFVTIRLGVESLSPEKHAEWGGKAEPGCLEDVAQAFFDAGYKRGDVGAYMLAGLPMQSAAELERDIKSLIAMGIRPFIAEYSPLPGTPMFARAREVSRYDISNEPLAQNNSALPCASEIFTFDDLQRLKHLTWSGIFP